MNLLQRGVALHEGVICEFCLSAPETMAHLFLHCPKIWHLWADVLNREGVLWIVPESIPNCLAE